MYSKISLLIVLFHCIFCNISDANPPNLLKHGGPIQAIEFSPIDPSLIVSAGDNSTIRLWNLSDNTSTSLTGHTDKVNSVTFSPDGSFLVSGSNDLTIRVWDVQEKKHILTLEHKTRLSSPSTVISTAFSPNGKTLATAGYKSIILWDVKGWVKKKTLIHDDWVNGIVFSPNGEYLASVDGKLIKVWDHERQQVIARLDADSEWVGAIAFSPDSRIFATAGSEGKIKLWSTSNWQFIREIKDVTSVSDLVFSPDGESIASAGHQVVVWSVQNGKKIASYMEHNGWVMETAFSPDGTTIASGGLEDGILCIQEVNKTKISHGQPNTVRLIYFIPSDLSSQHDIDAKLDKLIKTVQNIYANNMEYYGFGKKTFKFETDEKGNAVIHHVKGKFKDEFYQKKSGKVWDEIDQRFDTFSNIYLTALESRSDLLDGYACGFGGSRGDFGGTVLIPASGPCFFDIAVTVHELGHAFGLAHDYRNNLKPWVNLYTNEPMTTSKCAAHWLIVHHYFNSHHTTINQPTTIKMAEPTSTDEVSEIRFEFDVSDPDGLHQAQFLIPESHNLPFGKLYDFKVLNGEKDKAVFLVTQLTPKTESIGFRVMDKKGFFTEKKFRISMETLLPPAKVVSIPDVNLRAAIRKALGLSSDAVITQLDLLNLYGLNPYGNFDVSEHKINNISGIEHATNLTSLNLSKNLIHDISPLTKLKKLRVLKVDNNQITNIQPLAEMTNLKELSLSNNPIKDMSSVRLLLEENPNIQHDVWHSIYNVDKITGPWLWMIAPTESGQGGANAIDIDSLSILSKGTVTENIIAAEGVRMGDVVDDRVWKRSRISDTSDNNLNELARKVGFINSKNRQSIAAGGYVKDHNAYAFITLSATKAQRNVRMFVGSDDAIKVWLNGKVVFKNAINRGAETFQDSFIVDLKAKDNLLLVKVGQSGYKWSMFVGIDADVTVK